MEGSGLDEWPDRDAEERRGDSLQTARPESRATALEGDGAADHAGSTLATAHGTVSSGPFASPPRPFHRGTHIIAPLPGLVRDDEHVGLCGRFGAGGRWLRSGARVAALYNTSYCRAGDVGFVWRTSLRKIVVRLDCGAGNVVLPPRAFCVKAFDGALRDAKNVGGGVPLELPFTARPKGHVFQLLTAGSATHVHETEIESRLVAKSDFPYAKKHRASFDVHKLPVPARFKAEERRMERAISPEAAAPARVALSEGSACFALPWHEAAQGADEPPGAPLARAAAAAAALVTVAAAGVPLVTTSPTLFQYFVVRPRPACRGALPTHGEYLVATAVDALCAICTEAGRPLPDVAHPEATHVTLFLLGCSSAVYAEVAAEARLRYRSVFLVLDCDTVSVLYPPAARPTTAMVAVANGRDIPYRVVDELLRGGLCVWRYARERDPYGRRVVLPRAGATAPTAALELRDSVSDASSEATGETQDDGGDAAAPECLHSGLMGRVLRDAASVTFTITAPLGNVHAASGTAEGPPASSSPEVAAFLAAWPRECRPVEKAVAHGLLVGAPPKQTHAARRALAAYVSSAVRLPIDGNGLELLPTASKPAQPRTLLTFPGTDLTPLLARGGRAAAGVPLLGVVYVATVAVPLPPLMSEGDRRACRRVLDRAFTEATRGSRSSSALPGAAVVAVGPVPR
eukprot:TRINITY_DN32112_c0_g1_i1.p1 TRINITY_DN32112_c0_g1~~TRINITY_DN32112_c0_g1_i1.p1  ORF type:complete len:687 (+),score=117.24 TRINITY_DN32112_c0_g1_i1:109-2169(+)